MHKVRKFGVLSLFILVGALVSLLFMGGSMMSLAGMLIAAPLCDGLIVLLGGYRRSWALYAGIGFYDLLSRVFALGTSYLFFRETPGLLIMGLITVSIGYLGCLLGLIVGAVLVKEFKHACIIRE
jgi:energy-coupling factor transport system substrate-specific component